MFKNVTGQKLTVYAFDSTTNLPKTGDAANLTAYVSLNDGTVTALGDTSATEASSTNAPGQYVFDLAQAETNADKLTFSAKSSTANIVVLALPSVVYTRPPNFSALGIGTSGTLTGTVNADAIKINGSADAASALGSAGGIAYNNNNRFPVDVYSLNGMVIGGTDGTVATATVSSFTVSGTDLTADIMPGTLVGFTGRGYRVVTGVTYDGDTTVTIAPPLTSAPSPGDAFVIVELPSPTLNSNGSVIGGGGDINNVTVEITETRAS